MTDKDVPQLLNETLPNADRSRRGPIVRHRAGKRRVAAGIGVVVLVVAAAILVVLNLRSEQ